MSRSKRREERARRQREATNKKLEESVAMGDVDRISRLKDSSFKNSLLERARKRREELGSGTGVGQTQGADSLTGNSILNRLRGERPITGGPIDPSRRRMLETKGPEQLQRQRDLMEGLRLSAQGQTVKSGQITDPLTGQTRFETPEEKQKRLDLIRQQINLGGKRITPQQPGALPTKVQEQQSAQQPAQPQQAAQQQAQIAQQQQTVQPQSIGPQQQEAQMRAQMYQTKPAQEQQPKPAEQAPQMTQQPAQQPEESEEEKKRKLQAQQMA
jgi:hypothetical protein